MGYVPPHHNITAVNYGSRMPEKQHQIRRGSPAAKTGFSTLFYDEFNRQEKYTKKLLDSYQKRRNIEQQMTGKGQQFDEQG